MTKEEYQKRLKALSDEAYRIKIDMDCLKQEYIDANRPCEVGDRVDKVFSDGSIEPGIVSGFEIDLDDEVKPIMRQIKKDGTASIRKIYVWRDSTLVYHKKAEQ